MPLHDTHIPWPISAGIISFFPLGFAAIIDNTNGFSLGPISYQLYEIFQIVGLGGVVGFAIAFVMCAMTDINAPGMMVEKGKLHIFAALVVMFVMSICANVIYKFELEKTKTMTYVDVSPSNSNVQTSFTKSTAFSTSDGIVDYVKMFNIGKIDEKRHFTLIETRYHTTYGVSPRIDFEYALIELPMGIEKLPDDKEIKNLTLIAKKELSLK